MEISRASHESGILGKKMQNTACDCFHMMYAQWLSELTCKSENRDHLLIKPEIARLKSRRITKWIIMDFSVLAADIGGMSTGVPALS